jgi:branched-chain amino acid transport system permease protein
MSGLEFTNLVVSALLLAGVYAVMSVGMTVIYGVMKIVNLAHAGFMMIGAYLAWEMVERFHLDPVLAALIVFPIMFAVGKLVHWTLVRWLPHSDQPTLASLLLMFGLWLVLQNIGYLFWGNTDRAIFTPRTLSVVRFGPISVASVRLVVFIAAVASMIVLQIILNRSWFGRSLRSLIQNRYAGRIVGVNAERTESTTFALGIAFGGFAGALLASLYSFNPDFGRPFLIRSFVIIVLGGLESIPGVAVGALILALVETFSIVFIPAAFQLAISYGLLVVILIVLPGGIASLVPKVRRTT